MTFSYFLDEFAPHMRETGGSRRRQQWKQNIRKIHSGREDDDDDDEDDDDDVDDVDDDDVDDVDDEDDDEEKEEKDIYTKNLTTPTEGWGTKSITTIYKKTI